MRKGDRGRVIAQAVETALVAAGEYVNTECAARCPVDTGRLVGSLTYATRSQRSRPRDPATANDTVRHDGSENTVLVGTNVEYAPYVEYGTRRSAAKPYLRTGLTASKKNVKEIMERAFIAALGK